MPPPGFACHLDSLENVIESTFEPLVPGKRVRCRSSDREASGGGSRTTPRSQDFLDLVSDLTASRHSIYSLSLLQNPKGSPWIPEAGGDFPIGVALRSRAAPYGRLFGCGPAAEAAF
jgi:hypothetical protein